MSDISTIERQQNTYEKPYNSHNICISVGTWQGPQRQKYMDADRDYLHHYRFGCFDTMGLRRVALYSSMAMRVLATVLDATNLLWDMKVHIANYFTNPLLNNIIDSFFVGSFDLYIFQDP